MLGAGAGAPELLVYVAAAHNTDRQQSWQHRRTSVLAVQAGLAQLGRRAGCSCFVAAALNVYSSHQDKHNQFRYDSGRLGAAQMPLSCSSCGSCT